MAELDALLAPWLGAALVASAQFAVVFGLALLLDRSLLRRAMPRTRVALWAAVLLPLAVPIRPEIPGLVAPWEEPDTTVAFAVPAPMPRAEPLPLPLAPSRPSARASRTDKNGAPPAVKPRRQATVSAPPSVLVQEARERPANRSEPESSRPVVPWRVAVLALWGAGFIVLLVRALRAELRLRRALRTAPESCDRIQKLAHDASRLAGLRRAPRALQCDALASPAVHGPLRPRFLVPESAAELDDDALRAVLVHEAFHVRRGDLVWFPLVALLRAVWWFHPLVPAACRSLADALEEARDLDALGALEANASTPNSPARLAYARVLVRIAEDRARAISPPPRLAAAHAPGAIPLTRDGRGLSRRVTMIVSTPPPRRLAAFSGVGLALGVVGLGLVRASGAPESILPTRPQEVAGIQVERPTPLPAWRAEIDAALARPLRTVHYQATEPLEAFRKASRWIELPINVNEEELADRDVSVLDMTVNGVSGSELLNLLCLQIDDFGWSIANGAIHVGDRSSLPEDIDLRFYRVAPLLEARGIDDPDELEDFVLEHGLLDPARPQLADAWEREGWSLHTWRGMLAVRATEDGHRALQASLDRLLAGTERPAPVDRPWRAPLDARLDGSLNTSWTELPTGNGLVNLAMFLHTPVLYPDGDPDDNGETFDHEEGSESIRGLLERIAARNERYLQLRDGAVVLAEVPVLETHFHPVAKLLALAPGAEDELFEEIVDFVREIDSESWDMWPSCTASGLGDLLVVHQRPSTQEQIRALLAQLERALSGS